MSHHDAGALRILVVDDHRDTVVLLCRLLMMEGHSPIGAASCREAMAAADIEPFDMYVLDVGLPDGDGCDLLNQLTEKRAVPAVAITGYSTGEEYERAGAAGFCHILVKPFFLEDLQSAIARCREGPDTIELVPRA